MFILNPVLSPFILIGLPDSTYDPRWLLLSCIISIIMLWWGTDSTFQLGRISMHSFVMLEYILRISRATWVRTRQDLQAWCNTLCIQSRGKSCSTQLDVRHRISWSENVFYEFHHITVIGQVTAMIITSIPLNRTQRKSEVIYFVSRGRKKSRDNKFNCEND